MTAPVILGENAPAIPEGWALVKAVAIDLHIDSCLIYEPIRKGFIPSIKVVGGTYVEVAAVVAWRAGAKARRKAINRAAAKKPRPKLIKRRAS